MELAEEFGCSAQTIRNRVAQEAIDQGKPLPGKEGLTTAEREEWCAFGANCVRSNRSATFW
jgi:transposase